MASAFISRGNTVPVQILSPPELRKWLPGQPVSDQRWIKTNQFSARPGSHLSVPGRGGVLKTVLIGARPEEPLFQLAAVQKALPRGNYQIVTELDPEQAVLTYLGWGLAAYRFRRYKKVASPKARLLLPKELKNRVDALLDAHNLVRDLINTPTEDLGPAELVDAVRLQAGEYSASMEVITGDELLDNNFPAVHAVGRASDSPPALIHLRWGDSSHPRLALVGKGVCFDSGGLDIKSAAGMLKMKKDMGGAAHALALARLVMDQELPVRLDLIIPAVENSIAGNAYRPGDVISTRQGLTVEIGNTDAEGRVILSDGLTLASEDKPDLIVDFATLTGAARVALGTDLPALFTNNPAVSIGIFQAGERVSDPVWPMPLYQPYKKLLASKIADLNNVSKSSFGGAITAALFLEHFVDKDIPWVHLDTYAWSDADKPARPAGGEAMGLRAVFEYLTRRYS